MTRWLLSWRTHAVLAVLAGLLVVVGLLSEPVYWSSVVTGVLVAVGSVPLAVSLYRAQHDGGQE